MTVYIQMKQIKKRGAHIIGCPYILDPAPESLRHLITHLVSDGVRSYNARLARKDETVVLSRESMEAMETIGKIGFGIPYGTREADRQEAIESALQGFEDGLYRIFIGEREVESLDERLHLKEDDTITIIRLVMLTGGFF